MRLSEQIEHCEHDWCLCSETPWQNWSKSRKKVKRLQHKAWRHWSKSNRDVDSLNPLYSRYSGFEY